MIETSNDYKNIFLNSIKKRKIGHFYIIECSDIQWCIYFTKWCIKSCFLENNKEVDYRDNFNSIDNEQYVNLYMYKNIQKKTIGLEEIKKIKNWLELTPILNSRRFISVIHCDYFTKQANNSLLKILEEPKNETTWFLFVDNLKNIEQTLISRAQIIYKKFFIAISDDLHEFLQNNINIQTKKNEEVDYILEKLEQYAKKFFLYNDLLVAESILIDLGKEKGNIIYKYFILLNEFFILNNNINSFNNYKNLKKFIDHTNIFLYISSLNVLQYAKYNLSISISATIFSLKLNEFLKKIH